MKVPFFDYKKFCKDLNYQKLVQEALDTGYLIGGPFIDELEEKVQEITGIKNCITVGNATDAMEIIFEFLKLPIGSKVLVPAHTMLATASAAQRSGLIPIPVEVDENSLLVEVNQLINCDLTDVSACMITQLNGVVADMDPIKSFCDENKIILVEDSAQGIGAFNNNMHAGAWGIAGCLSFYPAKVIGGLGDGGAIITNDNDLTEFARSVRDHGRGESLEAVNWGRNSRLDSINARIVLERLYNLDNLIEKRRKLSDIYNKNLKILADKNLIKLPPKCSTKSESISTYQNYEIQVEDRDKLMNFLKENNVGTIKQWGGFSIAHFEKLGFNIEEYKSTKKLFEKLLLLPMNHLLLEEEVQYVSNLIKDFFLKGSSI
tara:strand:+ start:2978 stop:4102 length:1125 start_codon:yes stop_codon:yes gene_type:complete